MKTFALAMREKDPGGVELAKITEKLQNDFGIHVLGCGGLAMHFRATEEAYEAISEAYGRQVLVETPVWYVPANEAEALSGRSRRSSLEFVNIPLSNPR